MQKIMEPIFEIAYLIVVAILGILILRRAGGRPQFRIFGIMAIVLGCGDAFHLVPRIYALLTDGLANHAAALGFGKLVTSVTMTVFYVLIYHIWKNRYHVKDTRTLSGIIYLLAIVRVALCLFPQNDWLSADAPLSWGIYRNLPFAALGILLICLYFSESRKQSDRAFRFMWLAITLSFIFYIPVVLWADTIPTLGMLMIPKTCAYICIVSIGYRAAGQRQ